MALYVRYVPPVLGGGGGSSLTIGTFDSEGTPAANALTISAGQLIAQSASATVPGMINTGAQTIAGAKTFNGPVLAEVFALGTTGNAATGTITLTNTSTTVQVFSSGSGSATCVLPDATTLAAGWVYELNNNASGNITVQANGGTTLAVMPAGSYLRLILLSASFSAGQWDLHWLIPTNNRWGTSGLVVFPTTSGTIPSQRGVLTVGQDGGSQVFSMIGGSSATFPYWDFTISNDGNSTLTLDNPHTNTVATTWHAQGTVGMGIIANSSGPKLTIVGQPNAGTLILRNNVTGPAALLSCQDTSTNVLAQIDNAGNFQAPSVNLTGSSSGTVSILPQAAAGTYNFNLPITAGSSGQVLTSAGGGSSAMTWSSGSSIAITSLTGDVTGTGPGATATTVAQIQGTAVSGTTGTGNVVFASSPTITTPTLSGNVSISGNLTMGSAAAQILNSAQSSYLKLIGGTTVGTDPALSLYGSSHANAGLATLDSNDIKLRSVSGTTRLEVNSSGTTISSLSTAGPVITSGAGLLSSEASLAASRGGTGGDSSAQSGIAQVSSGTWSYSNTIASAATFSYAGTASTPGLVITGAPYAGTNANSFPQLAAITSGASAGTSWSTAGTLIGGNAASGFTGNLLDLKVNGTTQAQISYGGALTGLTSVYATGYNVGSNGYDGNANNTTVILGASRTFTTNAMVKIANETNNTSSGNGALTGVTVTPTFASTAASTTSVTHAFEIKPTYNFTGTGTLTPAITDLFINGTETAIGSGTHLLVDAQVGGSSKFSVDNTGRVLASATQVAGNGGHLGQFVCGTSTLSVANGASDSSTTVATYPQGLLIIGDSTNGYGAVIAVMSATTTVVSDPSGKYSNSDGAANKISVSIASNSAGTIKINNQLPGGLNCTFRMTFIGGGNAIN